MCETIGCGTATGRGHTMNNPPERPVRVLYCIDAMGPGGTEKQLAGLIHHLDLLRVAPCLCTLRPSLIDLSQVGCEAFELPFTSLGSPGIVSCVRELRQLVRRRGIDLVHAFFQDATILAYLGTVGTRVVRVGSFRDLGFWRTRAKVRQLRLVYPRYHGFVANSRAVARHAHDADGLPPDKVRVIPNGVTVLPEPARRRSGQDPVVGIVANLNREVKRVDLFLRAARLVADAVSRARFEVVGDGHLRPMLTDLCDELGLARVVSFHGRIPNPSAEIARFDVGVLTSDSEGLSNAILEYMAAGVPAVARRVGGNEEAVTDGETGYLVDGAAPADIARPVIRLLQDEASRERMGARARAVAATDFSWEACARRHERYYSDLMQAVRLRGHACSREFA
jgi:L-malate glycosyltransferase